MERRARGGRRELGSGRWPERRGAGRFAVFRPRPSGAWWRAGERSREWLRPPAAAAHPRRASRERAGAPGRDQAAILRRRRARPRPGRSPRGEPCGRAARRDPQRSPSAAPRCGRALRRPGPASRECRDRAPAGRTRTPRGTAGDRRRANPRRPVCSPSRRSPPAGPRGRSARAPRGGASGCAWPRRCSRASPRPPRAPAGAGLRSRPCLHRDVAVEAAGACRRKSFVRVRTYKPEASAAGVARLISPRPFFASSLYSSPASSTNVSPSSLSR